MALVSLSSLKWHVQQQLAAANALCSAPTTSTPHCEKLVADIVNGITPAHATQKNIDKHAINRYINYL